MKFKSNYVSNLLIVGGITASDNVLLSSYAEDVYYKDFIAPCGLATIILEINTTDVVQHSLHLEYQAIPTDFGEICNAYSKIFNYRYNYLNININ
jgi:hypothetical protein